MWWQRFRGFPKRAKNLFWSVDPLPVEIASGLTALGWAVLLTFSSSPMVRPAYTYFALMAPTYVWTLLFYAIGVVQLTRVVLDCSRRHLIHQAISGIACFCWIYVTAAFVLIHPDSPGTTVYYVVSIGSLWAFLRTGWEERDKSN